MKTKQMVRVTGEVQLPIQVGKELYYRRRNLLFWTDRVERILEITEDYVRVETTAHYYRIERWNENCKEERLAA